MNPDGGQQQTLETLFGANGDIRFITDSDDDTVL